MGAIGTIGYAVGKGGHCFAGIGYGKNSNHGMS